MIFRMNSNSDLLLAMANPSTSGEAWINPTNALLGLILAALVVVAFILNQVVRRLDALARPASTLRTPPVPVTAAEPPAGDFLSPELMVIISAACHVALGRSARVVAITDGGELKQVWSLEGRRQIFASHQTR